jgi:signal transduction histidine kinase
VNASTVLNRDNLPDAKRLEMSRTLTAAATSLNSLLSELLDHARLEAGRERRNIRQFDAARVIKEFCETARPVAAERNLFLKCEGPPTLEVQGDPVKMQRIMQNLVLNALKATQSGGVQVTWEASESAQTNQWALCVQDTGPGFGATDSPIRQELKDATAGVQETEAEGANGDGESLQSNPAQTLASKSPLTGRATVGEGIGLSIVKRLCELLDASIELQSEQGRGTTFRVIFPMRYADG